MLKKSSALIFCLISFYSILAQNDPTISSRDLKPLIGSWQGTLTYLDYSSGKPYTMPADIDIKRIQLSNKFVFANTYPEESSANSTDTVTISNDGRMINEEIVKSKRKRTDGNLEIMTEILRTDGNENKPAVIRHTYIIGKHVYIIKKDVQFVGQTAWIKRNEYNYKNKPSR